MKKILTLLLCFYMSIFSIQAQENAEFSQVRYLLQERNNLRAVRVENGKLEYPFFANKFDRLVVEKWYPVRLCADTCRDATLADLTQNPNITDIAGWPKKSIDEIIADWQGKEFVLGRKDSTWISTLQMISPGHFLQRLYNYTYSRQNNSGVPLKEFSIHHISMANLTPLQLYDGHWIWTNPRNNEYIAFTDKGYQTGLRGVSGNGDINETITLPDLYKYPNQKPEDYEETQLYQTSLLDGCSGLYETQKVNGGYRLKAKYGSAMLPMVYDSIHMNQFYIAAKKDGLYTLMNVMLQPVQQGVRSYVFKDSRAQCVVGNELKWATLHGKPSNQILDGQYGLCGTVPHFHEKIFRRNGAYYLGNYTNGPGTYLPESDYKYKPLPGNYDAVTFLNGGDMKDYNSNTGYREDFSLYGLQLLIAKKSKKFGLIDYAGKPITAIEYDSIPAIRYMDDILRLYKNGNVQFYPIPSPAKAKEMGFSEFFKKAEARQTYFVRVQRLSGKWAWYNLINGEALEDE